MITNLWGSMKWVTPLEGDGSEVVYSSMEPVGVPPASTSRSTGRDEEIEVDGVQIVKSKGRITALDLETGKGVIDRKFKVDIFNFIPRGTPLERGDLVEFETARSEKDLLWKVVSLKLVGIGMEKIGRQSPRPKNLICKVVKLSSEWTEVVTGAPNPGGEPQLIKIPNKPELSVGFEWIPGDWLTLRLQSMENDDGAVANGSYDTPEGMPTTKIVSVAPFQRKTVIGKVTKKHDAFLIDDSVYFTQDARNPMFPSGSVVKCDAISSNQILGSDSVEFRAIGVVKSNFLHYAGLDFCGEENCDLQGDDIEVQAINRHKTLMEDKCGIKIAPVFINFPVLMLGTSGVQTFTIKNDSQEVRRLKNYRFSQDSSTCPFEISCYAQKSDGSVLFGPDHEVIFDVRCTPSIIGRTAEVCVFDFGICRIAREFTVIGRAEEEERLFVDKYRDGPNGIRRMVDQNISQIIADMNRKCIRGSVMVRAPFFCQKRLPIYRVPRDLIQIIRDQDESKLQAMYLHALEHLKFENYKQKFQLSLWFEEIENDVRRRQYDQHNVILERCGTDPVQFTFTAPGIQDFHPQVNMQDTIDVFDPRTATNTKFQGSIVKIVDDSVVCIFGEAFNEHYTEFPLTIQFNLGRNSYKRCHFAVETAVKYLRESFLFPEPDIAEQPPRIHLVDENDDDEVAPEEAEIQDQESSGLAVANGSIFRKYKPTPAYTNPFLNSGPVSVMPGDNPGIGKRSLSARGFFVSDTQSGPSCSSARLEWFNHSLNEEQRNAVRRILQGKARPIPYIVYGPPGTGKTVTLVEAVMQLNHLDKNSRILVCAPSNSAADVIVEHLLNSRQYRPGDFVRLNGFLRSGQTMPEYFKLFCTDGEDLMSVANHGLIVSTCTTAGQFFSLDLNVGHFTHVFVDEAGYCTEPEIMVPATLLALSKGGQLILAGDPNQLGPVLMSDVAENIGLKRSFLERLMDRKLYCRDEEKYPIEKYNPLVVTKLVKNYRAHPTLLKLPSELFYHHDLESMAPYEEAQQLCLDPNMKGILVREGVPLIFHGVQGQCIREQGSTSWCNKAEAVTIVHYVSGLIEKCGITTKDIGIITPYRKQVEMIRMALMMNLNLDDDSLPKVASVEEFQGGERKIILISTVRSGNSSKIESLVERFGFLYEPKRFNVAITRAKALLIVVGNPFVLARNQFWLQLLRFALDLNAYRGCNTPIHLDKNVTSLEEGGVLLSQEEDDENDQVRAVVDECVDTFEF